MDSEDFEEIQQLQKEADEVYKQMLAEGTAVAQGPDDTAAWVAAGESGYVNCLITVLGEGPATSTSINIASDLPNLNDLAEGNPSLKSWTEQLNFDYSNLSKKEVIAILVNSFDLEKRRSGRMKTVLVNSDNAPIALIFTAERPDGGNIINLRVLRASH